MDLTEFSLRIDKPAPPLRDQPPPPVKPKPVPGKRETRNLIESFLAFREWLNTPSPPKPPPAPAPPKPVVKKPRAKPFDLQDVPGAMDRIGWPMSAKVMRKWFAGELNYATTDENARLGINQYGKPFPPSMIDTTMFKLDWILGFTRAKEKYDELIDVGIYSPAAKDALVKLFRRQKPSPYFRDGWKLSEQDMPRFHREFQFQLTRIDADFAGKLAMFMRGASLADGIFMDDLYGSLGAFTLNVAIGGHYFFDRGAGAAC